MKLTATFLISFLIWGLQNVRAQDSVEITQSDREFVAQELEKEAEAEKHDRKTKDYLKKIAEIFKSSQDVQQVEIDTKKDDCTDCSKQKAKDTLTKIGQALGKGSAWVTTTTSKPFMSVAGLIKGFVEKGEKNRDLLAMYQFFLNHQEEFDNLYLEAGTPEEMIELMLFTMEEIIEKKSRLIMQDLIAHLGIKRKIPQDMKDFELTAEEISAIDESKLDVAFINNHPEYKEIKPLVGEMTKEEFQDIVTSGYFYKAISFENYNKAVPSVYEIASTIVGQLYVPKIALGVISNTLAGLYVAPVVAAQIGTGVSVIICLQKEIQEKFESDIDLKSFCSYVTNRTSYQLLKGRAKGYVAGKKFHGKISEKLKRVKEKRAEKIKQNELGKQKA